MLWAFLFAPLKDHHLPSLLSEAVAPSPLAQAVPGLFFRTPFVHLYTVLIAGTPFFNQAAFTRSLSDFHPRLLLGQVQSHAVPQTCLSTCHSQPWAWGAEGPPWEAGTYVSSLYSDFKAAAFLVTCDAWRASSCWPARLHALDEPNRSPCFLYHSPRNYVHAFLPSQMFSLGE